MPKSTNTIKCSFCGKPQEVVKKIIAGPNGVFICDECVEIHIFRIPRNTAHKAEKSDYKPILFA